MKILNITRLWIYPCKNPTGVSLHVDSEPLVTTFWVLFSNELYSHFIVHSSKPYFLRLPVGMFGEEVPESLLRSGYMTKLFLCCPQDPLPFHWRKSDWFDMIFLDKCMLPVTHLLVILEVLESSLVICSCLFWEPKLSSLLYNPLVFPFIKIHTAFGHVFSFVEPGLVPWFSSCVQVNFEAKMSNPITKMSNPMLDWTYCTKVRWLAIPSAPTSAVFGFTSAEAMSQICI